MSPPYTPAEEIADYMDIVFNFGFISMFHGSDRWSATREKLFASVDFRW